MRAFKTFLGTSDMTAYLAMMASRLAAWLNRLAESATEQNVEALHRP